MIRVVTLGICLLAIPALAQEPSASLKDRVHAKFAQHAQADAPAQTAPPATNEASQAIAAQIGNLVISNAQLAAQLRECQQQKPPVPPAQDNH